MAVTIGYQMDKRGTFEFVFYRVIMKFLELKVFADIYRILLLKKFFNPKLEYGSHAHVNLNVLLSHLPIHGGSSDYIIHTYTDTKVTPSGVLGPEIYLMA